MQKMKLVAFTLVTFLLVNIINPMLVLAQEEKVEPISLTIEMAQEKAVFNQNSIHQNNRAIKNLIEGNDYTYYEDLFVISDASKEIKDLYEALKYGKSMNSQQYAKLYILYTMYGDTEYFKGKEDLTKYMNPNRFTHYSLWANVMKLTLGNQVIEESIKYQTRALYENILSLKSQQNILNMTIELQERIYKQQKSMYDLGQISKAAIDSAYKQVQIKKLEVRKLTRTIDNIEMDLKKLTGLPIDCQLELVDYTNKSIEKVEDYDTYLNKAFINRNEILTAKIDYWVAKNDMFIANEAFSNNPWNINAVMKKNLAEQKINEAELTISTSEESVLQSVNNAYIDVKYKNEEMSISKQKLDYENEQYRILSEKYKKHLISQTQLKGKEIEKLSALSAYNDAIRAYNMSVANLEQVSNLGVAANN